MLQMNALSSLGILGSATTSSSKPARSGAAQAQAESAGHVSLRNRSDTVGCAEALCAGIPWSGRPVVE